VTAGDTGRTAIRADPLAAVALDPEVQQILTLRSRDRARIQALLHSDEGLPAALVPHVIPLLAWDPVASEAVFALRKVAEEHVGQLIDALIDPNTEFSVRRRLARVFSVCVSQRAADGLLFGLDDMRFEVRYQCARSLAAIVEKNPRVRVDRDVIFELVRRETTVSRSVWKSQRLLQRPEEGESSEAFFVDEFVQDRASRSLAHVFTLLSLVVSAEPLKIAFRGLHTDDANLRGTALEYLEGVLPPIIREPLWPFLEDPRPPGRTVRSREEIVAELLRSNQSIAINLAELRRGSGKT
jgi:HEAT repeat protein